MSVAGAVGEINGAVTGALGQAATAFDRLVAEQEKQKPDPIVVLGLSGEIWSASIKAWANLVLAPGRLASEIVVGGK
jgi:hypothetical protein